ncbi:MAG: precorrin-8X methylmutase [Firmicutes bacterium]|jgi:precorrin-8X/cobalt-precorrin-8 methylmutase|uniref:Precorrin-8X methylmutase n=1 Tax=Sulfobacillus benefaciens TaxID=453960 RepID=A0A2T2WY96_9FIRM|nr:precorrin-8X methylmutase [Bacillota bacterium]MCL5015240.1 precorrin-8X methylmutase [Bacillota bacterium]PSR27202.1 MAG: precorrin-8X methylmutase [Sulfobacillus benefaciens]HBQ96648.1 precorrin-8X methylmutase [Sulfobacillus sp.]
MKRMQPEEIYQESFRRIRQGPNIPFSQEERYVVERIIHATADWEYRNTVRIHEQAMSRAISAIRLKAPVVTDVEMVLAGLSRGLRKQAELEAWCYVDDPDAHAMARHLKMTRSAWGIRRAAHIHGNHVIVVIANAPTALLETLQLVEEGWRPHVIIGVPVGFVMAKESKERLEQQSLIPYITNLSEKGGSAVGAAIVNALLLLGSGQAC